MMNQNSLAINCSNAKIIKNKMLNNKINEGSYINNYKVNSAKQTILI